MLLINLILQIQLTMKKCKTIIFLAKTDSYLECHVINISKTVFFYLNLCKDLLIHKLISSRYFSANPYIHT